MARLGWSPRYRNIEHGVWCIACFLVIHYIFSSNTLEKEEPRSQHREPQKHFFNQTKYLAYINSIGQAKVNVPGYEPTDSQHESFWRGAKIDIKGILMDTQAKMEQCDFVRTSKPDCSLSIFKRFFRRCGYFPSIGSWLNVKAQSMARFELDMCFLPIPSRTVTELQDILMGQNIRSIATVGNVHSFKSYKAIKKILTDGGYTCLENSTQPESGNFHRNGRKRCACRPDLKLLQDDKTEHNISASLKRLIEDNSIVNVEHFDIDILGDRKLKCRTGSCPTETEYVFNENLRWKKIDILLIFPTFNKDKHSHYETVYEQLTRTIKMVEKVKAKNAVWLTNPAETKTMCSNFAQDTFEFDFDANAKINALNHLLFQVLKPQLEDMDQDVFSVIDLFSVSQQLKEDWSIDCQFYKSKWYSYIVSVIFGLLGQKD